MRIKDLSTSFGSAAPPGVPAPGHTPGSIIVFVTLPKNVRYALVGDLVWQREGLTGLEERPLLSRLPHVTTKGLIL